MKPDKQSVLKAIRKAMRELDFDNGWKQIKKVHKSKKNYNRKKKHK